MRRSLFFPLFILCLLIAACAPTERYPLGMSAEQYNALSYADQQAAWEKQYQLEQQERERQERAALTARRAQLEAGARARLGILPEEWASYSNDKRMAMIAEQEAIDRESADRAEELDIRRQEANAASASVAAQERANAIRAKAERDALYNNPIYGNVVDCTISGGIGKFPKGFGGDWRPLDTIRFSLAKGDEKVVTFQRKDKQKMTGSFYVSFSGDGRQEMEFCAGEDTNRRYKRCRKHTVEKGAFERGYTAPFSIPDAIDQSTLSCKLAPGRGQ